jgi:lipoprotein-releasing system ATP-binding protein
MSEAADTVVLQCHALHKRFREGSGDSALDVHVLRGVDLQVHAGRTLAIVGASGSGKSTLLHLLGALDAPSAGRVQLMGRDFATMNPAQQGDWRNRHLGFCRS